MNPYSIILALFVVTGLLVSLWGWRLIINARKTRQWPLVIGLIETSTTKSDADDLLPHIVYSYQIEDRQFRQTLLFPADVTPTQEFASYYVEKFPAGSRVEVYYDPENPEASTLEPGLAQGDWLVFAIGLGMLIIGLLLFFAVL